MSLFDRWNTSLKTGDPQKVVENYAVRSILIATLSNEPRRTPEAKVAYFKRFLKRMPVGKVDFREIVISCNAAVDTGLYTFSFSDGEHVKARYTFTYKWDGRRWWITSHIASRSPEDEDA